MKIKFLLSHTWIENILNLCAINRQSWTIVTLTGKCKCFRQRRTWTFAFCLNCIYASLILEAYKGPGFYISSFLIGIIFIFVIKINSFIMNYKCILIVTFIKNMQPPFWVVASSLKLRDAVRPCAEAGIPLCRHKHL